MDEEKKVKVLNWDINYLKVGNGPCPVFCMPGFVGTIMSHFRKQVEGFDREQFTLVVWDPPGYGKSRPPERDGYPVGFYENDADLAYEFMKVLGINKYCVLGGCAGGWSAMILAAKHPEAVNKLVIRSTNSFLLPEELEKYRTLEDPLDWPEVVKNIMMEEYGLEWSRKYCKLWVEGLENLFSLKGGDICSDLLERIRCPTLILFGEKDSLVHKSHANFLHENIKGSRVHLYPDGAHSIHITHSQDFNTRVQQFLVQP